MLQQLPASLNLLFIGTTVITFLLFLTAVMRGSETGKARIQWVLLPLLLWLIFQSTLALNGWYMDRKAVPPHLGFPVMVAVGVMLVLFLTRFGRSFIQGLSIETLTWLHIVRIPVEITLYLLATWKQVPWSMTFEGMNFDILSGITAPIIAILYFRKQILPKKVFLIWNIAALTLVLIVVIRGIGAAPSPVQLWDFEQPNYAVMHFPFIWLPAFVVPVVVFSHIATIYRLLSPAKA